MFYVVAKAVINCLGLFLFYCFIDNTLLLLPIVAMIGLTVWKDNSFCCIVVGTKLGRIPLSDLR